MDWMITARLEAVSDTLRRWYTESELRQRLADDLVPEIDRINDAAFAREYQQHCPVPGVTDPASYNNRVLELADGSRCLTGIRFRGGDMNRPFVDLVALEGVLDHSRIGEVVDEVDASWGQFAPRAVRILHPDPIGFLASDLGRSQPDQLLVAGRLDDLRRRSAPAGGDVAGSGAVGLRPARNLDWYDSYVSELEELFRAEPARGEMTRAESRDDLAETFDAGLLFEILVDERWAGVLASPREAQYGMCGYYMQEMMLAGSYRGHGFASAAQRQLAGLLPAEPDDVLFGTIDARNQPSMRTATSVGREVVGGYLWLYPHRVQHSAPIVAGWDPAQLEFLHGAGYTAARND